MIRGFALLSLSMFAACVSSHASPPPARPTGALTSAQAPEDPSGDGQAATASQCGPNATCNVECDGGRCGTACGAGATCNLECDGGSCATACAPEATCNTECDGGNCT